MRHSEDTRPACELEELARALGRFSPAELREIPIMRPGVRLMHGNTYLDLDRGDAFTAAYGMEATRSSHYVPKAGTPFELWHRLLEDMEAEHGTHGGSAQ